MTQKDISILGNVTQADEANFTETEKEIARIGRELDRRFRPQFERREFIFTLDGEKMKSYLPEGLHDDTNLVKTQHVPIAYNVWTARNNPETAETIFALGGIYNSARRFDFFAEGAAENFNVIALDYPGKGHSGNFRMPGDYTLENYADVVGALIKDFNPSGKFHLLGHSHGTKVIYTMVEQGFNDPNWAGTIIGDMPPETPAGPKLRRAWRNRERPTSDSMQDAVRKLTNFLAGHGDPVDRNFVIHDFNHGFEKFTREGYGWAYDPNSMYGYADEYLKPYDKWQAFKDIPTPILLLAGEKSNTATPDVVQKMLQARPDTSLLLYQGVGHYPELVTPKRISEVVAWIEHAGDIKAPLRAIVPADPTADMKLEIVQDNKPTAEAPATALPKRRALGGPGQ
ncbi:MAG TPA: alpha/beta hydrolase [Patescibacteria group bacterium]|nr:alpha/beta hydrolase [Patescibacteria group bacterium]